MRKETFAIRCPSCFNWTTFPTSTRELTVSPAELVHIVHGLNKAPDHYSHPKLLVCAAPHATCPAPAQALLFSSLAEADAAATQVPSWMPKRTFRLFRADRTTRYIHIGAMVFCTVGVRRHRDIELPQLVDPHLLSRATAGISLEMHAPVTVFAAKRIRRWGRTIWYPIEAYERRAFVRVPQRYNDFCHACRDLFTSPLLQDCGPDFCTKDTNVCKNGEPLCFPDEAICRSPTPDWNQCPYYSLLRHHTCLCYRSDIRTIERTARRWRLHSHSNITHLPTRCWAGLTEIAVPIVVHQHLIAVGMTGQFVLTPASLISTVRLKRAHVALKVPPKDLLEALHCLRHEPHSFGTITHATPEQKRRLVTKLKDNTLRISEVAEAKYRSIRLRREEVFREELLGKLGSSSTWLNLDSARLLEHLLGRMCEFWAFRSAMLLTWTKSTGQLLLLAKRVKGSTAMTAPRSNKSIAVPVSRVPPLTGAEPWYRRRREGETHQNKWIAAFYRAFQRLRRKATLRGSDWKDQFFVFYPTGDHCLITAMGTRNSEDVSGQRAPQDGDISPLCAQAVYDTVLELSSRLVLNSALLQVRNTAEQLTKGALASSLLHDITRPVRRIRNDCFIRLGDTEYSSDVAGREVLQMYLDLCDGSIEECDSVRQFYRTGVFKADQVDASECLRASVRKYRDVLQQKGVRIETRISRMCMVEGSNTLMRLVFDNILQNALDHLKACTVLQVYGWRRRDGLVEVCFEDSGEGFPEALVHEVNQVQAVPEVLSQRVPAQGLTISRQLVTLQGGQFVIGSALSGGALVRIALKPQRVV